MAYSEYKQLHGRGRRISELEYWMKKDNTSRERSRTFPGLSLAMSEQWDLNILNYKDNEQLDLFSI